MKGGRKGETRKKKRKRKGGGRKGRKEGKKTAVDNILNSCQSSEELVYMHKTQK